jgi:hypothetical protein
MCEQKKSRDVKRRDRERKRREKEKNKTSYVYLSAQSHRGNSTTYIPSRVFFSSYKTK